MKIRLRHAFRVLVLAASGLMLAPDHGYAARPVVTGPTIGATGPDVCLTPSTPQGVPIPYPNIGNSSSIKKTTRKVKTSGDDTCATDDDDDDDSGDDSGGDDDSDDNSND